MQVTKTISLKELNESLKGRIWEKADKKRIYLDKGYNTKKMKTTTYVEVSENELFFVVKCFIDCPSQSFNWIDSQQDLIIESVTNEIENILNPKIEVFEEIEGSLFDQVIEKSEIVSSYSITDKIVSFNIKKEVRESFKKRAPQLEVNWFTCGVKEFSKVSEILIAINAFMDRIEVKCQKHEDLKSKIIDLENQGFRVTGNPFIPSGYANILKNNLNVGCIVKGEIRLKVA